MEGMSLYDDAGAIRRRVNAEAGAAAPAGPWAARQVQSGVTEIRWCLMLRPAWRTGCGAAARIGLLS
jgi:hypothetical protein